jgi:hypothetical protein
VLGEVPDPETMVFLHFSLGGFSLPSQKVHEGTLPTSVWTEKANTGVRRDVQGDVLDDVLLGARVAERDLGELKDGVRMERNLERRRKGDRGSLETRFDLDVGTVTVVRSLVALAIFKTLHAHSVESLEG